MKLNWLGTFGAGQGYSGSSEEMALALERAGINISVMRFTNASEANISAKGNELMAKPFEMGDVGIAYGFPNSFTSLFELPLKTRIGFTMFETDTLPNGVNGWAGHTGNSTDIINKLDALFVPSEHNKEVFKKSGVTVPIYVIPLGVNPNHYKFLKRPKRDTFTFLIAGVLTLRKNPGAAITSFLDAFKTEPLAKLIVKTKSGTLGHMTFPKEWGVKIIDHNATQKEMIDLYWRADAFLFPSRGEGFGLPVLEAMATGLPVIFADNSGMRGMANEEVNYPIESNVVSKAQRFPKDWGDVGNWYEIDQAKLTATMKHLFENRDEARTKGSRASKWVKKHWTYDHTAQAIIAALKDLEARRK